VGTWRIRGIGNIYFLDDTLNFSKGNRNPFEWAEDEIARGNIKSERWNMVIEKFALVNGMKVDEFKEFVYWCEANKRTAKQIKLDGNKTSLELWFKSLKV
jgi:hypothetical protein